MHCLADVSFDEEVVALAEDVVLQSARTPGLGVRIPSELSGHLNAALTNLLLEDVLALRVRERSVSLDTLRLTLR